MGLPCLAAFPGAVGTGIIVSTDRPLGERLHGAIADLIEGYERALSRFRQDAIPAQMARASHGGRFVFPDYCKGLFDVYDRLYSATGGALDPMVGEDLTRLGYGREPTFRLQADAADNLGRIHGRPTWGNDLRRQGAVLMTTGPVSLDFGAVGKGYLVDLIADLLEPRVEEYLIDAGGDMRMRMSHPIAIAMEDPCDLSAGVGRIELSCGSLCASAPSRRHWTDRSEDAAAAGLAALHHILDAIDGRPVGRVQASWVVAGENDNGHPTGLADGLSTALFLVPPDALAARFSFSCALMYADRRAVISDEFPGRFFTDSTAHPST